MKFNGWGVCHSSVHGSVNYGYNIYTSVANLTCTLTSPYMYNMYATWLLYIALQEFSFPCTVVKVKIKDIGTVYRLWCRQ